MKHLLILSLIFCSSWNAMAETAKRPNILFIIFDDWGWQHAGAYGCDWVKTPNFDRVAREGLLFKNAFTNNPKCSPCRASCLTGRSAWQLEEASCHFGLFPAKFVVYPDLLEKAGYDVGLTGKGWGPGDFKTNGRTRNPAGPGFDAAKQAVPATGIGKIDYATNFETFLKQRDAGKPFCFWMGFEEPHRPYELDSGVRLGKKLKDVKVPAYLPDNDTVRGDLLDYSVEVEWGDAQVGRTLKILEAAGELENTLVVITSDHGMPFPRVKGQIYEDGFHIPLAMRWGAGIKAGRVVEDFVDVRDFAPTFMELAGLKLHEQMSGHSLASIIRSEKSGWIEDRKVMLVGKERHDLGRPNDWGYPVRAIRTPEFLYSHNFNPERWPVCNPETGLGNCDDGPTKSWIVDHKGEFYDLCFGYRPEEEFYKIKEDPECLHNLAGDPKYVATMKALRAQLEKTLRDEKDPRALGNGAVFDTYRYTGNRSKSYDAWLATQQGKLPPPPEKKNKNKNGNE